MENEMALPEEDAPATLRETLMESIAQHSESAADPVAPASDAVEAAPAGETAEQKAGRLAGRARDERGRVLPGKAIKQDSAAQVQKPDAGASTVAAQPAPAAAEPAAPALPPLQRPSSWPKEMWPVWDKMAAGQPLTDKEARQAAEFNLKRETQFASGVSTYKQEADRAKPLLEAIAPFQADLDQHGIQAPDMVHRLMSAHKSLALGSPQQKLQQFAQLAQSYGIPLQALYDQQAQQQYLASAPAQAQQPVQQAPVQDINKLVEQALTNREVQQTIASMASNTEKYPFFQYVRADMSQLLETGSAADLEDAYQQAVGLPQHALLTSSLQQQQAANAEAQRVAAAKATAAVARGNAVSPKSATPATAGTSDAPKGVRGALQAAIEQHRPGARV